MRNPAKNKYLSNSTAVLDFGDFSPIKTKSERRLEGQKFTEPVENTKMTDCTSSL
jgi:hypothetical protein